MSITTTAQTPTPAQPPSAAKKPPVQQLQIDDTPDTTDYSQKTPKLDFLAEVKKKTDPKWKLDDTTNQYLKNLTCYQMPGANAPLVVFNTDPNDPTKSSNTPLMKIYPDGMVSIPNTGAEDSKDHIDGLLKAAVAAKASWGPDGKAHIDGKDAQSNLMMAEAAKLAGLPVGNPPPGTLDPAIEQKMVAEWQALGHTVPGPDTTITPDKPATTITPVATTPPADHVPPSNASGVGGLVGDKTISAPELTKGFLAAAVGTLLPIPGLAPILVAATATPPAPPPIVSAPGVKV